MMATGTVEMRMYNVGFGDAFRVTVRRGDERGGCWSTAVSMPTEPHDHSPSR